MLYAFVENTYANSFVATFKFFLKEEQLFCLIFLGFSLAIRTRFQNFEIS